MSRKGVVIDKSDGSIERELQGSIKPEMESVGEGKRLVLPDDVPEMPEQLRGKKFDMTSEEFVADPEYVEPRTLADIKADLDSNNITHEEAVNQLLEVLSQ